MCALAKVKGFSKQAFSGGRIKFFNVKYEELAQEFIANTLKLVNNCICFVRTTLRTVSVLSVLIEQPSFHHQTVTFICQKTFKQVIFKLENLQRFYPHMPGSTN